MIEKPDWRSSRDFRRMRRARKTAGMNARRTTARCCRGPGGQSNCAAASQAGPADSGVSILLRAIRRSQIEIRAGGVEVQVHWLTSLPPTCAPGPWQ